MKRSKHGFIRLAMVFAVIHILMFSLISMAAPISNNPAQALYDLGLVLGTGTNDEGLPEFSLDAQMTRSEAIVMLVRMLGAERLSMFDSYTSPFTDVPAWAENHVGYAYATGMTNGVSETLFDGNSYVDQKQFCTLMLRALGYDDKEGDFVWSQSDSLAQALGLISSSKNSFTREDAFEICYNALLTKVKTGDMTLLQILANANAINADQIGLYGLTSYQVPLHYYAKYPDIPSALNVYPNITLEYDFDDLETREFLESIGSEPDAKFSETHYYDFDCHTLEESKAVASVYSKFLEKQGFTFLISEDNEMLAGKDIRYALLTPDQSHMLIISPESDGTMCVEINKFSNKYPVDYYEKYMSVPDYGQLAKTTILEGNVDGLYMYSGYQDNIYYAALLAKAGFVNGNRTVDDVAPVTHTFVNEELDITVIFGQGQVEVVGEPKPAISTLSDLETYLNDNMSSCTTPIGIFKYDFKVRKRSDIDIIIETSHINGSPWYDLEHSESISASTKEETLSILRDFQKEVYQIASSAFPEQAIAGGFCDTGYRYIVTALSWSNHKYDDETENYAFYWETARDWYDFNSEEESTDIERDITTIEGFENYLNDNLNYCETPLGSYSLKFTVEKNQYNFNGWDIEIKTEGNYCILPWADISNSIEYSEEEKQETLDIFRELQKNIYEIASNAFPDKKLTGCYFSDWYKYPSLKVGYNTSRHLTWTNYSSDGYSDNYESTYITSFHWDSWRDDAVYE